jgi:hypothetical protein
VQLSFKPPTRCPWPGASLNITDSPCTILPRSRSNGLGVDTSQERRKYLKRPRKL